MSLFRCEDNLSEDENYTEAQIQKKKIRLKMNRSENDPLFKGKGTFLSKVNFQQAKS